MNSKTDEEIVAEIQGGYAHAFGEIMTRYEPRLTRYARKFIFDHEDIKDLVQEVFIKAYVNIQSFDADRKFSSWIYRIAHNEFINALKKRGREKISYIDFDVLFPHPIASQTADQDVRDQDSKAVLGECLNRLSSKYREVLILFYLEAISYQEIADILEIPISTVGVRLGRARTLIKQLIAKSETI